jgi:beta-glucosidase
MTWPIKFTDHASSLNFPIEQKSKLVIDGAKASTTHVKDVDYTNYAEGIYVGYRYFDTNGVQVAYPFGYGLSYTTFSYGEPSIRIEGDSVYCTLVVTNTGRRAGKEVVQLYVAAPQGGLDKPAKELRAYAKTRELAPGESQTLTLRLAVGSLASYDEGRQAWVVAPGEYQFLAGASVEDIRGRASASLGEQVIPVKASLVRQSKH